MKRLFLRRHDAEGGGNGRGGKPLPRSGAGLHELYLRSGSCNEGDLPPWCGWVWFKLEVRPQLKKCICPAISVLRQEPNMARDPLSHNTEKAEAFCKQSIASLKPWMYAKTPFSWTGQALWQRACAKTSFFQSPTLGKKHFRSQPKRRIASFEFIALSKAFVTSEGAATSK